MKDKQWKDYWDVELGVSYIPIDKLDPQVNMALLEEGGMFDDDTMPDWMKTMRGVAPSSFAGPQQMVQPQQQAASAPPQQQQHPQFIPIPDGLVPPPNTGTVGEIPHPPGLPPFGLPPPGAPGLAGLLAPPHSQAGLIGAAPPNILLGPPLGPPPPAGAPTGVLGGPPPGFPPPGFDASQPPPGLRGLPGFPPGGGGGIPPPSALTGAPLGGPPPNMNNAIVNAAAGNKGESSMDMDVEDDQPTSQRPKERRNREGRQSRWGSKEPTNESNNGPPPLGGNNGPQSQDGPPRENNLANRLRSLAGHGGGRPGGPSQGGPGGPDNNGGGGGPPEIWNQNGMDGPPMGKSQRTIYFLCSLAQIDRCLVPRRFNKR